MPAQIFLEPPHHALASRHRTTDDQHCIVAGDRARDIRPRPVVERLGHRLRTGGNGAHHDHHLHCLDADEELRQHRFQPPRLDIVTTDIGERVAHPPLVVGDARQAQLAQVARQRRLGHVPPTSRELSSKLFLTRHQLRPDDLANRVVSVRLVGHAILSV